MAEQSRLTRTHAEIAGHKHFAPTQLQPGPAKTLDRTREGGAPGGIINERENGEHKHEQAHPLNHEFARASRRGSRTDLMSLSFFRIGSSSSSAGVLPELTTTISPASE